MGCFCSKEAGQKYQVSEKLEDGEHALPFGEPPEERKMAAKQEKEDVSSATTPVTKQTTGKINEYQGPKSKLNPKDFEFIGLRNEVRVKPPGSIAGQGFTIDNCKDCDIYLLDHCGQVTIDECVNTRIFIGPTSGSIFIRDSSNCVCAFVCRQLRTRDVTNTKISLMCRTRPIVESSSQLGFCCLDVGYPELKAQLDQAKLSPLHNFWSHTYDYTPKPGNYSILPATDFATMLAPVPEQVLLLLSLKETVLLVTGGDRPNKQAECYALLAFPAGAAEGAMELAASASNQGVLQRSNYAAWGVELASQISATAGWSKQASQELSKGLVSSLELSGPGEKVQALVSQAKSLGGYSTDSEAAGSVCRYLGIDG